MSDLSLNWRVTVRRNSKPFMTTDYNEGIGHAPSYKASVQALGHANSLMRFKALLKEAETGRRAQGFGSALNPPSAADVIYCLERECDALDHARFEDWADEFGYDHDSREAERIYKACLETALKMRAAIGEAGLEQLREAFQDY